MRRLASIALLAAALWPARAAALTQPNGATIPSPLGCASGQPSGLAATFACECVEPDVCNIGAPCPGGGPMTCDPGENGTCESTLWHSYNDNSCIPSNVGGLDPWAEADVLPETFHPTCALTFTVVTRGTAIFGDVFGWYNVTGGAPSPDDLHVMLDCDDPPGTAVVLDLGSEPAWAGGDVGFFIITPESHTTSGACAGGNCCASLARLAAGEGYAYYSERQYNPDAVGPSSFIHLAIYDSHVWTQKFYFAWEDIYGGSNNDFTDLVTSVSGVECSGAGVACDTGLPGACARGVTSCAGGMLSCVQLFAAEPEVCDGLDNDCDGVVDAGATCGPAEVCQHGRCVPHCSDAQEFNCPADLACDEASGWCVDPACAGMTCPPDEVCRDGVCAAACDGIVCPHGRVCVEGACVDLCGDVVCGADEVCSEGLCVPGCGRCGGLTCAGGDACEPATGACVDGSCPGGCPPPTYCDDGACKDPCEGALCPPGEVCAGGDCVRPWTPPDAGPGPDPSPDAGGGGGGGGGDGGGGGCGCMASGGQAGLVLPTLLPPGLWVTRRRRGLAGREERR